jgi:hypothetical protein
VLWAFQINLRSATRENSNYKLKILLLFNLAVFERKLCSLCLCFVLCAPSASEAWHADQILCACSGLRRCFGSKNLICPLFHNEPTKRSAENETSVVCLRPPLGRMMFKTFEPFEDETCLFCIRTQCVPRSKNSPPRLYKTSQLISYKAKVAVCSKIHKNA